MSSGIINSSSLTNIRSGAGLDVFISFVNLYVGGPSALCITFSMW